MERFSTLWLGALIIRNVGIIQGRVVFDEEFTCMNSYYYSIANNLQKINQDNRIQN